MNEFNFKSYGNSNQTISYCEVDKCKAVVELKQQLDQLKAENEELTKYKSLFEKTRNLYNEARMHNYELLDEIKDLKDSIKRTICQSECYKHKEADKLKQTLTEIKPILEFYANSKMGEEQPDRTYKIMCSGDYIMVYDPKPAREALQKISEVLNDK